LRRDRASRILAEKRERPVAKNLIDWAAGQHAWVSDSLRRIATAADHVIGDEDAEIILANVRAAARAAVGKDADLRPLDVSHLGSISTDSRRTILAQLGPVENIDRLACDQRLRIAAEGITLVYGENGSGKSGYTRIAKRLCRSLSVDQLRGNVFATASGPMRVEVRYRVGDDEVQTLDWDPATPPPSVLRQISVFDSHNARLYVDGDNRIAYLPHEIAILEHHGDVCQRIAQSLNGEEKILAGRLKVPLPAGYTAGTEVSALLGRLVPTSTTLPSEDLLRQLGSPSEAELLDLASLESALAMDPIAQAATRERANAVLKRVEEVFGDLGNALSNEVSAKLQDARQELVVAVAAEKLAASSSFSDEPMVNVGGPAWRIMFEAARAFATSDSEAAPARLPEAAGDLCFLCLEPLSPAGSERLKRFNDFVSSEASRRADRARDGLKTLVETIGKITIPAIDVVEESLYGYRELGDTRQDLAARIIAFLDEFGARRTALLDETATSLPTAPDVATIIVEIAQERQTLEAEALALQQSAAHSAGLDAKRTRLAYLKDRVKLGHDLETMLQRLRDLVEKKALADCLAQVATRPVSNQITALRKELVTEALEKRIIEEIETLDLAHLPFKVSDSSAGGQSLFSVGLKGAGKIRNNQILSEGEQRALALACFLAEIGGNDPRYGIIVDDPVSSLDHLRLRKVAQRLVAEAQKGRQVIVFTHNLVFFNEMISEAARAGDTAPLIKSVVSKTVADGFGIVRENSEPWVADLNARIAKLRDRVKGFGVITDFDTDEYRRQVKDFYSDLRETWERAVEEVVLAKTVVRFVPDVMTGRLKEVAVTDEDYRTIFFAMKRASERSGHDMSAGRDIPQPSPHEMAEDVKAVDDFRLDYNKRRKLTSAAREALESPRVATLL
jgi:energy-coupling factor transporter ATP-binding protein EcfA2